MSGVKQRLETWVFMLILAEVTAMVLAWMAYASFLVWQAL